MSVFPPRTAKTIGENLPFDRALMLAPASINAFAASVWPSFTAHISAVCPREFSVAFTFAPWAMSAFSAATFPVFAAVISAVSPSGSVVFASAPAFRSSSIIGGVAVAAGERQRRDAVAIRRLDVGAGANQLVRCRQVVALRRPVERRRAVSLDAIGDTRAVGPPAAVAGPRTGLRPSRQPPPSPSRMWR